MKPAPFAFHSPRTVADAVALLEDHGDDGKVLAGGQSLVPMLALRLTRFEHLVDINRIEDLVAISRSEGYVKVGAMARQCTVATDPHIAQGVPLLARATPYIGHFQIRNRGTIGGSLAHGDPAAEYPAVALALDARFELTDTKGIRLVDAHDFFRGTWTTAMRPAELLTAVEFPVWGPMCGFAIHEVARRHGDFALVGAVAAVETDGHVVTKAAVGIFGVGPTPVRAAEAEAALLSGEIDPTEVGRIAAAGVHPADDAHATASYRTHATRVLVTRAITDALEEARRERV